MLQRFESSGSRLATDAFAAGIARPADLAAGSVMRLTGGDVAADLRPIRMADKRRRATYELLVANETQAPLATFAYALEAPARQRHMTWNAIVVPPFSAIAVEIDIAVPRRRAMPRVVADLFAGEAQLTLDAPPHCHPRAPSRRAAFVATAVVLLALGAGTLAATRPRVLALAAPDSVRAGTPFSVAYAFGDATGGRYFVESAEGMQLRRGTLFGREGAFTIALPGAAISHGYDVHVWARGGWGSDERTTHVVALPSRTQRAKVPQRDIARPAGLGPLALERDIVHGGDSIVVAYRAPQDPGSVRLIDAPAPYAPKHCSTGAASRSSWHRRSLPIRISVSSRPPPMERPTTKLRLP